MSDNIDIIVQDTINDIVVNSSTIVETIDITVEASVEEVTIISNPNDYIININKVIGEQVQSDWDVTIPQDPAYIKNKPTIPDAQVNSDWNATTGVAQILNKPTIPTQITNTSELINDGADGVHPFITAQDIPAGQVNSDWNATSGVAEILNKPTIPAEQVNSDWNATTGKAQILNKPTIPSISGLATVTYVDQQDALKVDKIAGKGLSTNDFTNTLKTKLDGIQDGAEVNVNADCNATSGDAQILNKPTIPAAVTKTSELINDGADGVNPFITDLDIQGLTTADIADSLNKRYVTDANLTTIGNQSGTNTGDETTATIKSKLGITTLSGSNTGDQDLSGLVPNTRTINTKALSSDVTLTTADIADSTNKRYQTDNQNTYNDATSSIQTQLNSKQSTLTNPITGTGTANKVAKFNGTTTLTDSVITEDGTNVGIGTASPSSKLGILISDNTPTIAGVPSVTRLMNNGSGNISKITLTDNTISDATISFLPAAAGNSTLSFGVQGTTINYETLNIKENGNVGIGTTSPASKLEVNGVVTATGGNSTSWNAKQDALVSGTNIKTINGNSVLGSGDLVVSGGGSTPIDIQLFTASGVWTKPAGASYVEVYLVSGGGGGGSGRRGATLTARYGGGGGSSGAITSAKMNASSLSSTENIWIGTGGNGGAAIAVNDTNGATGSSGLTSYFGGTGTAATSKISTSTGVGGAGGTNVSNSGSSSFGSYIFSQLVPSGSYASGSVGASAFGGGVSGVVLRPLNSGVYGGGITAANVATAGQSNRITGAAGAQIITVANGGAVGSAGDAGSFITNSASNLFYANGGAGGGSGDILGTIAGGAGGAGAYGAGGAGGGASTNGANSGAGGRGGDGFCIVVTYF